MYGGPYSPITDLVLIATGLGVVPMIQMVKELLPSKDSSVSAASGKGGRRQSWMNLTSDK